MNYLGFRPLSKAMSAFRLQWSICLSMALACSLSGDPAAAKPELEAVCAPYTDIESDAAANETKIPYGEGVLWRIEATDTKPSHLFGTLHSQDRRVTGLESTVRLALARSERLVIEVVPDAEANQIYRDSMYSDAEPGLDERLPAPLYERLKQLSGDYGLSAERLEELAPWAAFSQIGRPKPASGPTLDRLLYQTARQSGKPVIGLESMTELVEALASLPRDDQLTILEDTLCNHAQIMRDSRILLEMYLEGDLAGMVVFNKQSHYDEAVFERFMDTVLYERNSRMIERMLPYIEQGASFIAVGALHLPDEGGLLKQLEQAGYTLTRID